MEGNILYNIDWKWLQDQKRSPAQLVRNHMCAPCQEQFNGVTDDEVAEGAKVLKQIGKCCSTQEEFFSAGLPVLETVFRLFLLDGNEPKGIADILEQLKTRSRPRSLDLTEERLSRLLDADSFYGLRQQAATETSETAETVSA